MKRTSHITLSLLAGMALAFTTGCQSTPERRDCVDESGRLVDDGHCVLADEQRRTGGYSGPYYHYLYGGSSGGHFGDAVFDGNPTPGMSHASSGGGFFSGISRGGFGGHGGEGGGHGGGGE